jgi:hypothetical protein
MKTFYLLGTAVCLLATACSSETEEQEQFPTKKEITFSNVTVSGLSKTNDQEEKLIDSFSLYGWVSETGDNNSKQIFDAEPVYNSDGIWTYNDTQYWINNGEYQFLAISPQKISGTFNESTNSITDFSILNTDETLNGTNNLMVAKQNLTTNASSSNYIKLDFQPLLSKVKFSFTNNFAKSSNINLIVSNVQIENAYEKGDIDITTNQWSNKSGKAVVNFGNVSDAQMITPDETALTDNERLLIPSESSEISYNVTFDVTIAQDELQIATYKHSIYLSDVSLKAGGTYNFEITIDNTNVNPNAALQPIGFTATISDWNN